MICDQKVEDEGENCFFFTSSATFKILGAHNHSKPMQTTMSGTKVDAGAIAAPFRAEVREKVEALKAKGIGEFCKVLHNQHKMCRLS